MQRLRATRGARWLALLISVSIFASFVAPVAVAAHPSTQPYADWLRNQLREPADEVFESALAVVEAKKPTTFHAYLTAFVRVYDERSSEADLSEAFTGHAFSREALLLILQFRYHRVVGEAVLPPVILSALVVPQSKTPERHVAGATSRDGGSSQTIQRESDGAVRVPETHVRPIRDLVTAQPLGP